VALQLGFTDVQRRALRNLLVETIESDRYPFKTGVLSRSAAHPAAR
jgi:hypothetical protein